MESDPQGGERNLKQGQAGRLVRPRQPRHEKYKKPTARDAC